jgi:hypothetical protein
MTRTVLVLTAGTVATGAIDPLDAGTGAAWRHVDVAWAGPLRLTPITSSSALSQLPGPDRLEGGWRLLIPHGTCSARA